MHIDPYLYINDRLYDFYENQSQAIRKKAPGPVLCWPSWSAGAARTSCSWHRGVSMLVACAGLNV
jgi:hypothetical protein